MSHLAPNTMQQTPSARESIVWLLIILTLQLLLWWMMPSLLRQSLSHDTTEAIAWGMQWQLGYNKHPPLNAWLCAAVARLSSSPADWSIYLLAQSAVAISFFALWRLARKVVNPQSAAVSVVLLVGIIFYGANSPNFTPDTLQTPIWAAMIWIGSGAILDQKKIAWLWLGILASLALWAKYQAPVFFVPLLLATLFDRAGRQQLTTRWPYIGLAIAIISFLPHLIWAYQHHFPEIKYALVQTAEHHPTNIWAEITRRLINGLLFVLEQLGAVAGCLILTAILIWQTKSRQAKPKDERYQRYYRYVSWMTFGPFLLSLLYSLIAGTLLIHRWGTPYYSTLGLWVIMTWRPHLSRKRMVQLGYAAIFCIFAMVAGRYIAMYWLPNQVGSASSDMFFPSRAIASQTEQLWQQHENKPLLFVAAPHYLAARISVYAKAHPAPFMDWSHRQSPWIDDKKMRRLGAMFVWPVSQIKHVHLPVAIAQKYPTARVIATGTFLRPYPGSNQYVRLAFAILPPQVVQPTNGD